MDRFLYTFRRPNGGRRTFGPYATEDEAKEAFQRIYGYWPSEAVTIERYCGDH